MRDKFWSMIVDFKVAEYYYTHYCTRSKRWSNLISAICFIASASSISAWCIWQQMPGLWAAILAVAQVVNVLKPLYPFDRRVNAANYLCQDIQTLLIDAEYAFAYGVYEIPDDELKGEMPDFLRRYAQIENRFSTADLFPHNHRVHNLAQSDASTYFEYKYGVSANEGDAA